jgi:hypothetical protein
MEPAAQATPARIALARLLARKPFIVPIPGTHRPEQVGSRCTRGHPVYFVIFFPDPCPGQTLADVLGALRRFVETVRGRHDGSDPILYGNCQAGWAVTLLAADCTGLTGPTVLNGSPLSYWA